MTTVEATLPRWDLTTIFPSLESEEFRSAFETCVEEIDSLGALFDRHHVRRRESPSIDAGLVHSYEEVTNHLNALLERVRTLGSYIGCFVTTNARDDLARSRDSELDTHTAKLEKLRTRYIAWVGSSDVDALIAISEIARDHAFQLHRAQLLVTHQMSESEEDLAAELRSSAITGWANLHGNVSALLTATVPVNGEELTLPISSIRSLASDPDREVRKAAYEAELAAWESVSVAMAAALNGVKGFQQTLRRRRGWSDDLEPTLITNSIDRATLEAMQQACIESFPDFRRYIAVKARALGLKRLAWYDLNAPVGETSRKWSWQDAESFVRDNFGRYSKPLADFADRSFQERWIDAEPRVGKQGGAYCTGILPGVSRVMMNFDGSFLNVSTLAHELGHAYHNLNLKDRTSLQRATPMTLAETASIFCETLSFEAAMARANREERISLLDTSLQRDLQVVVDIHSRFLFEKAVFAKRAKRDLTVNECKELMLDAQRQTYGDDLQPLHPYMWAVKGHYYGPTFYNYPYTFGLLFGLGLYARYKQDGEALQAQYDGFLSSTGLDDAAGLARRFRVEITQVDFWRSSLDVIRGEIEEFEKLVG